MTAQSGIWVGLLMMSLREPSWNTQETFDWALRVFSSCGEPEIEEILDGSRLSLHTDQPTSFVFFSFLVEFHRDRGIEWRGILYPTYPVLLQSPSTHVPCILQRFWHTLSYAHIYSSQKENIVIPEMTPEANLSHSSLFLGREHGNVQTYRLLEFVEN